MAPTARGGPVLRWFAVLLGLCAVMVGLIALTQEPQNRRIARDLAQNGIEIEARILSARIIRNRLPNQALARSAGSSETLFYSSAIEVSLGARAATPEIYLTEAEYTAFEAGSLGRVTVIALPDDPSQVERNRGDRLAAAPSDRLIAIVLILMGALPVIGAGLGPGLLRRFGGTR